MRKGDWKKTGGRWSNRLLYAIGGPNLFFPVEDDVMADEVKPIPDGYHTVTPYLIINGATKALDFYKRAFGATEIMRMERDGSIGHAEIKIGNSPIMLADECPEMDARGPQSIGGSPVSLMLYVEDVDSFVERAVGAGAVSKRPITNQFYGDRSGTLQDPFGHLWHVATHIEDVPMDELKKRAAAMFDQKS
jgi:PhnB protein